MLESTRRYERRIPLRLIVLAEHFIEECRQHNLPWELIPKLLKQVLKEQRQTNTGIVTDKQISGYNSKEHIPADE